MDRGMSRLRVVLVVILAIVLAVGAAFALGILGVPSVENVENRFGGVNDTTTIIDTTITVYNPNPASIQLGGLTINYTVDLNAVRMANGTKSGLNVTTGNATLDFRTAMANEQIPPWWVSHIRNGEQSTLQVHATVTSSLFGQSASFSPVDRPIETDILSAFNSTETRPVNANQPIISDPVLYINETGAAWGAVSEQETPIDMRFVVYNPKPTPYAITEIGYTITMNTITVGEGQSDREHVIPPHTTETIQTVTAIQNQHLDDWWVSHLERTQVTDLRIDFYARVELTDGQTVRVPLDALTYTESIETDIFGTKPETTTPAAGEPTPTTRPTPQDGTRTSTPTQDRTATLTLTESGLLDDGTVTPTTVTSTATPTASPTPTRTPTPTPTETDDGGILSSIAHPRIQAT